ncbi:transposase [Halalkalibacter kiskunsagensis]|uniref:Transposase n=1 Tax=Halalkalibacter kiskunsagensis TaxID=1548599 RepID=A0ABV6KDC3_9BACI
MDKYGISKIPVRYIEFVDEKGRTYRILTTRFDLTDQQIMDIYRNRWVIELFFKWIKQHLKLPKSGVRSHKIFGIKCF